MGIALILALVFCCSGLAALAYNRPSQGDQLYALGRYQEAVAYYQRELAEQPQSARLYTNLGCALYQLGRNEEALKAWQQALELKPDAPQAARIHYNIGNLLYGQQRTPEAVNAYKHALRLNPGDSYAKFNLEVALKQQQQQSNRPSPQSSGGSSNQNQPQPAPSEQPRPDKSRDNEQPARMSKEDAERILEALRQNERGPTHRGNNQRNYVNSGSERDW